MNTTAQIRPPRTSSGPGEPTRPRRNAGSAPSECPSYGELLAEVAPVIEFIPQAGPPVVFVLGPWPFLAAPYLLVRHLRRRRARHPSVSAAAAHVFPIESPRVAA